MAYVNVYAYDRGDIELDRDNIKIILKDTEKNYHQKIIKNLKKFLKNWKMSKSKKWKYIFMMFMLQKMI